MKFCEETKMSYLYKLINYIQNFCGNYITVLFCNFNYFQAILNMSDTENNSQQMCLLNCFLAPVQNRYRLYYFAINSDNAFVSA